MFTQQHYEKIANEFNELKWQNLGDERTNYLEFICMSFARIFAKDNDKFNREKFMKACGYPS